MWDLEGSQKIKHRGEKVNSSDLRRFKGSQVGHQCGFSEGKSSSSFNVALELPRHI